MLAHVRRRRMNLREVGIFLFYLAAGALPLAAATVALVLWLNLVDLKSPAGATALIAAVVPVGLAGAFVVHNRFYWPRFGVRMFLREGECPACEYRMAALSPEPDGCTVCPECGAAWRLGG